MEEEEEKEGQVRSGRSETGPEFEDWTPAELAHEDHRFDNENEPKDDPRLIRSSVDE